MHQIYYHIDKSNLIEGTLMPFKESKFMVTSFKCLNAFPYGFMTVERNRLVPNLISSDTYDIIYDFFQNRNLDNLDRIVSDLESNDFIHTDVYIKRVLREIIFEVERLRNFSNKPSRLSCMYLMENKINSGTWKDYLGIDSSNYTEYIFEAEDPKRFKIPTFDNKEVIHRADAKWLEIDVDNLSEVYKNASNYWEGNMTSNPLVEILFYGVLKQIIEN